VRSIAPQSAEMERYEGASHAYDTAGLQILELAQMPIRLTYEKSPRTRASRENSRIELDVRINA
jgi:hypothetical protein